MGKRVFIGLGLVALLAIGAVFAATRQPSAQPQTVAQAKTKAAKMETPDCLSKKGRLNFESAIPDQASIEQELAAQLVDVPAGTTTQIIYATYHASEITGTEVYPDNYGMYNFAVKKSGSKWEVTSFVACKG